MSTSKSNDKINTNLNGYLNNNYKAFQNLQQNYNDKNKKNNNNS